MVVAAYQRAVNYAECMSFQYPKGGLGKLPAILVVVIFDVSSLVSYVSQFMTLSPADIISTGTLAGVGWT